ncbi:hypothetical protein E3N88_29544 [Mikania micrantha]|uniref:Uncharacterized protein n=1 Tax=Mikania micrantha TaxID=192012 RepID=A0A5N6MJ43_9ASTR|nr:hypothetical protein E3N88_29544 [Mikania micrantha]
MKPTPRGSTTKNTKEQMGNRLLHPLATLEKTTTTIVKASIAARRGCTREETKALISMTDVNHHHPKAISKIDGNLEKLGNNQPRDKNFGLEFKLVDDHCDFGC